MQEQSKQPIHLVIAGGGTGGHLYPGVAVVEAMKKRVPETKVSFVGTERGIEARVIPALGYDFYALDVLPLKSGGIGGLVKGIGLLPVSGHQANKLISTLHPDYVLAVGGYAAGPFTALAAARRYRTAFMEQNANLGLTNRLLAKVVNHAFLSFESTSSQLPKRLSYDVPGNPIRAAVVERSRGFEYNPPTNDDPFHLLILGGSGGASSLNLEIPKLLSKLPEELQQRLVVTHQAGPKRLEEAEQAYQAHLGVPTDTKIRYQVVPFIDDMATAYAECDLLICRAGMSTIAELTVLGLPCLFVPFPSKDQHQQANAEQLVAADAGAMILDSELGKPDSVSLVSELIRSPERLSRMAQNAKKMGHADAADQVASRILKSIGWNE